MDKFGQVLTDTTTPTISQTVGGLSAANVDYGTFLSAPPAECSQIQGTLASSHETELLSEQEGLDGPEDLPAVSSLSLWGAIPNPARHSVTIYFDLPADFREPFELAIFDVAGRRVFTAEQAVYSQGRHAVRWDGGGGQSGTSGIYFARLRVGEEVQLRKVVVVK
jgi:hypothetical protein